MGRKLGRGKPKKSAGDVLFVAVKGKTEEDFFAALRRRYRIPGATAHCSQRWERARFRGWEISKELAR